VDEGIWMEARGVRNRIVPRGYEHHIGGCR
jgi:hypothetical protein